MPRLAFHWGFTERSKRLPKKRKVSLAWVVRDAAERYVADRTGAASERTPTGVSR